MLYIIYGDHVKSFEKSDQMIDLMLSKKPDANILVLNDDNFPSLGTKSTKINKPSTVENKLDFK
jgi:hypothetical protein